MILDIFTAHPDMVAVMLLDPQHLIDRSIADLTQLSILLAAEIRDDAPLHSPELPASLRCVQIPVPTAAIDLVWEMNPEL
jgi:hypothetical protein